MLHVVSGVIARAVGVKRVIKTKDNFLISRDKFLVYLGFPGGAIRYHFYVAAENAFGVLASGLRDRD